MKRTHQEMSGAAPAPSARPAIVRDDFRKLAVPESVRRGVQQLVLQHVFAGTSYDSNRCKTRCLGAAVYPITLLP